MNMIAVTADTSTSGSVCAACGKDGDDLKACTACKLVKYCNATCQKAHRSKHKRECRKRAAEIYDDALFQEPPPNEDCPICFLPLTDRLSQTYKSCCGKTICDGCMYAMLLSGDEGPLLCPFCREPGPYSAVEDIERAKKRMELGDAGAFDLVAGWNVGAVPPNYKKAIELGLRAGELRSALAYHNVGTLYERGRGVEKDLKKAIHYFELAAMMGCKEARCNLAFLGESLMGNNRRSMKHFMIAARAGCEKSLEYLRRMYREAPGIFLAKDEYEEALRAYQKNRDAAKSEMREKAAHAKKHKYPFGDSWHLGKTKSNSAMQHLHKHQFDTSSSR